MATSSQLDRFIAAVHRRMVLLRAAERLGLCLLGGCIVLFILMPILIWRGQSTGELAMVTLSLSLIAGIAWAITTRPGKLAAAMEADRQLKLSDLLGSALLLRRLGAHDEIEKTVLLLAEARCAQFSPSTVVLHRLGSRGWGGIGLAAALVGGLCLMGPDNPRARALAAAGPKSWQEVELENDRANATHLIAAPDMRRVKEGTGADDDPKQSNSSQADPTSASANAANNNAASNNDAGGAKEGTGAGASQTASKAKPKPAGDPTAAGVSKTNAGGNDTAGGGSTAGENGNIPGKTGSTAAPSKTHKAAPIWQSQSWPTDQESARTALQSGKVPDAYRDLVRDYFERE